MSNPSEAPHAEAPIVSPTEELPVEVNAISADVQEDSAAVAAAVPVVAGQDPVPEVRHGVNWALWVVILLIVLAAAFGAVWFFKRRGGVRTNRQRRGAGPANGATMPGQAQRTPGTGQPAGSRVHSYAVNRPNPRQPAKSPAQPAKSPAQPFTKSPAQPSPKMPQTVPPTARGEEYIRTEAVEEDVQRAPRYQVGYAQTVGTRGNQEDSYCISNQAPDEVARRGLLAAVADGIGGLNDGEVASNAVMRVMCTLFVRQNPDRPMSDRLLELVGEAQREVLALNRQGRRCGSTLVSVLIHDNDMVLLSVGDSRICLFRSGGLLQLNREHVLGKESDEELTLHIADAQVEGQRRKAITAYMGKENLRLIDRTITPMRLVSGDRVLLMSDGVFGTLSDDEIIAAQVLPPDEAAEKIIQLVDAKGLTHQDNATIVIVEVN